MANDVFFTTNPAEFSRLEGLYISERTPPGFIQGVSLSTVGIAGLTVRGPSRPVEITSTARFLEVYGGRDFGFGGPLVNEIWGALLNKPMGALICRRIVAADAVKASLTLESGVDGTGTAVVRVDAAHPGSYGGDIEVLAEPASDGVSTSWNLRVRYQGVETLYESLPNAGGTADQDAVNQIIGDDDARLIDVVNLAAGAPEAFVNITEADWEAKDGAVGSINEDYMALGTTLTAYTSVAGSDGTLTATDYTDAVGDLAAVQGASIVLVAGSAGGFQDEVNDRIKTEASNVSDRRFVTWSGSLTTQSVAVEKAQLTTEITTRSDRVIWCFNNAVMTDPETGLEIVRGPHEHMASILANNDVDIHPGSRQTSLQTAGIKRLQNEVLSREDLIALKEHGICALEKLTSMFIFRSGVTTDLTPGKTEITRRTMADFLQVSAGENLRDSVKAKNTEERRDEIASALVGFSQGLKDQSRVVEDFAVDQDSVNTSAQRARGNERVLWRVRLIGHILDLVLETEIGTGVIIEQ